MLEPEPVRHTKPTLPVGVYLKYRLSTEPLYENTYLHAIANDLQKHYFNTAIEYGSFTEEQVEIFQSYGVSVLLRSHNRRFRKLIEHSAVIGCLVGDEPKLAQIDKYMERYDSLKSLVGDKPILTCMVGECVATSPDADPLLIWNKLQPSVRFLRFYPFRKASYNLLVRPVYKGFLPFESVLRIVQMANSTPYWIVLQSFGIEREDPYWRNPTPEEIRAMMHLSLAYGAKGIFFYTYQTEKEKWPAFVDQVSLQPEGAKFKTASQVARLIAEHAELLKSLSFGGIEVRVDNPVLSAVPLHNKNGNYIYAVNKDTVRKASFVLSFSYRTNLRSLEDIYEGKTLSPLSGRESPAFSLELDPGDGKLLRVFLQNKK